MEEAKYGGTMVRVLGIITGLLLLLCSNVYAEEARKIPVYPGSTLDVDAEANEQGCCNFITKDPHEKVQKYYDKELNTKPLTFKEFVARYPYFKAGMEGAMKEYERKFKHKAEMWFYILRETETVMGKMPEGFSLVSSDTAGTRFYIKPSQMSTSDIKWFYEYAKKVRGITPGTTIEADIPVYPNVTPDKKLYGDSVVNDLIKVYRTGSTIEDVFKFYQQKLGGKEGAVTGAISGVGYTLAYTDRESKETRSLIEPMIAKVRKPYQNGKFILTAVFSWNIIEDNGSQAGYRVSLYDNWVSKSIYNNTGRDYTAQPLRSTKTNEVYTPETIIEIRRVSYNKTWDDVRNDEVGKE